ncbi:hypothetical protein THAOC_07864, partial [Thalassiosira oceanica]
DIPLIRIRRISGLRPTGCSACGVHSLSLSEDSKFIVERGTPSNSKREGG